MRILLEQGQSLPPADLDRITGLTGGIPVLDITDTKSCLFRAMLQMYHCILPPIIPGIVVVIGSVDPSIIHDEETCPFVRQDLNFSCKRTRSPGAVLLDRVRRNTRIRTFGETHAL